MAIFKIYLLLLLFCFFFFIVVGVSLFVWGFFVTFFKGLAIYFLLTCLLRMRRPTVIISNQNNAIL